MFVYIRVFYPPTDDDPCDVRVRLRESSQTKLTADCWTLAPGQSLTLATRVCLHHIRALFFHISFSLVEIIRLRIHYNLHLVGNICFCLTTFRTDYIRTFLTKLYFMQSSCQI